jgi:RNA polymerase sigma-70 factor (ECF subfamily)
VNIEDVIEGCKRCEEKYQYELVRHYTPYLMTVARRYAPDHDTAYDILQESFIKILKAFPGYESMYANPMPWLRRIVINTAITYVQKLKGGGTLLPDFLPEVEDGSAGALEQMGVEELLDLIAKLPDGYREVFNLSVMEQYSHAEIGDMLGITESTSRSQLVRARRWLQNQILHAQKIRV